VRSTTFLFTTLCTSIQNFWETRIQSGAHRHGRGLAAPPPRLRRAAHADAAPPPRADVRPLTFGPRTVSPGRSFPMMRAHRDISNLAPAARPRRARPSGPSASTCQARLPRSVHALRGSPAHTRSTPEAMRPVVAPAYKGHAPAGLSTAVARQRSARACAPEDPLLIFGYDVCEVMTNSCTKNGTKLCCKCLYKKLFSISVESA
jgi:hypothetical protein